MKILFLIVVVVLCGIGMMVMVAIIIPAFSMLDNHEILLDINNETGLEFESIKEYDCYKACKGNYFYSYRPGGLFKSATETCTCGVGG